MAAKKVAAFYESWNAMYVQMLRYQWQTAAAILGSIWFPPLYIPIQPPPKRAVVWVLRRDDLCEERQVVGGS